jgi:hypothetical protein
VTVWGTWDIFTNRRRLNLPRNLADTMLETGQSLSRKSSTA